MSKLLEMTDDQLRYLTDHQLLWVIVEHLREEAKPSTPDLRKAKEAMQIVHDLAEWSRKWPTGTVHSSSVEQTCNKELYELEERAKALDALTGKEKP